MNTSLNFSNGKENKITKRYYCDNSSEIIPENYESTDQIYAINDNKLYEIEVSNEKTASGSIASFPDGADNVPVEELTVSLEPVQDLNGQSAPYPAGGGKNKFGASFMTATGITVTGNTVVGKGSAFHNAFVTDGIPNLTFAENTRYTLSMVASTDASASQSGNGLLFRFTYTDSTSSVLWLQNTSTTPTSYQATSDAGKTVSKITMSYGGTSGDNTWTLTNIQLESGTTATDYAPYSNICPITGHTAVEVWRSGVNVWDEEWELGAISSTDGTDLSSSSGIRTKGYIPIKPLASYYLCCASLSGNARTRFYDASKDYIGYTQANGNSCVWNSAFTTPANACYMRVAMQDSYGTTYNNDISINYPSTDHDYHAHSIAHIEIPLGQTVFGGTVDVKNGVVTVDRAMVDLGTLTWGYASSTSKFYSSGFSDAEPPSSNTEKANMVCSCYAVDTDGHSSSSAYNAIISLSTTGLLCVRDNRFTDVSAFTAAITGQKLCYELAQPITIDLTDIPTISTLLGQNNVWSDSGDVSVTYRADIQKYIAKVIAEAIS